MLLSRPGVHSRGGRPTVVDLFAGGGGFGLGLGMAGFRVIMSLEVDAWACETLRRNNPGLVVVEGDIREFRSDTTIKSACGEQPDLLVGGPPCQGFSIAGPAKKDPKDPRNSLFIDFATWVGALEPRAFVMENVKGLLARRNAEGESVVGIVRRALMELGYRVEVWVLNAAMYGVPQVRERVFVVGTKLGRDLGVPPVTHDPRHCKGQLGLEGIEVNGRPPTLWQAISDLPALGAGEGNEEQDYCGPAETAYQEWARNGSGTLFNHVAMEHSPRLVERFRRIGWGESSADVPIEHRARRRNGNGVLSGSVYDQNNRRLDPGKPSHTIAASFYANFLHPFQQRNLTVREGARIQSFPDEYRFYGKKTTVSHKLLEREGRLAEKHLCQYNQVGNAVPPLLARTIGLHIKAGGGLC